VLKVEFEDTGVFRSNYLSDLSKGGVRVNTCLEVGQRVMLNISFLGFVEPIQVEAIVQWAQPATHPDGPASGLAFVDPPTGVRTWIADVIGASTQISIPDAASRVLLLEPQAFLRDVYGQEVRNWAELRDDEPLDLITVSDAAEWLELVTAEEATLGILDVDPLGNPVAVYQAVRAHPVSAELPLIAIGTPNKIGPLAAISDDLLFCLRKPLKFGMLMNTVRVLARDPAATSIRNRDGLDD
jgi:Tfp pilus assembly protein PilZ